MSRTFLLEEADLQFLELAHCQLVLIPKIQGPPHTVDYDSQIERD